MQLVKWIDPETKGWRTGVKILDPDGCTVSHCRDGCTSFLVRESCDHKLTWVKATLVERWACRDEWERDAA